METWYSFGRISWLGAWDCIVFYTGLAFLRLGKRGFGGRAMKGVAYLMRTIYVGVHLHCRLRSRLSDELSDGNLLSVYNSEAGRFVESRGLLLTLLPYVHLVIFQRRPKGRDTSDLEWLQM